MTTRTFATRLAVLAVGAAGLLQAGCSTMNHTERGVLGGGAIGAGAGALLGKAAGNTGAGAAIGGVTGALLGGVMGSDADKRDRDISDVKQASAERAYQDGQPARIAQIVELSRSGQDEVVILNHIKNNRMRFRLGVDDLKTLKENGVSQRVVAAMQSSEQFVAPPLPPKPVVIREVEYVDRPVIVRQPPVVFVDPYAPPPGVHFHGRFR